MAVQGQPFGKPATSLERMRGLLENAMAYDYDIRVAYRGNVYEGKVRPSPHHPLSRFQIKDPRAVEFQRPEWRIVNDPNREGWTELFISSETLTEVQTSGGDPRDD